jgi:hypothetical protein
MCVCVWLLHGYKDRDWRMMSRYQAHSQWWKLQPQQAQQAAGNRQQAAGGRQPSRLAFIVVMFVSGEGWREGVREIATEVTEVNQRREHHGMGGSEAGSMGGCEGGGESGGMGGGSMVAVTAVEETEGSVKERGGTGLGGGCEGGGEVGGTVVGIVAKRVAVGRWGWRWRRRGSW